MTTASPQEASSLTESNKGKFIDVRTVGEALTEQLPGSLFLPFDPVNRQRLEEMRIAGRVPILVCRSGSRAKQAAEALAAEMDGR
ncbi:MAG: rhodanese-like domain-containing protein [Desulfopila sp.]|jgi:rhodanese-related sulfurtransferase|nr:rhodanese-like domain-containing protein [Desulfopila sp.]